VVLVILLIIIYINNLASGDGGGGNDLIQIWKVILITLFSLGIFLIFLYGFCMFRNSMNKLKLTNIELYCYQTEIAYHHRNPKEILKNYIARMDEDEGSFEGQENDNNILGKNYDSEAQTNMSLLGRKKKIKDDILGSHANNHDFHGKMQLSLSKILDQESMTEKKLDLHLKSLQPPTINNNQSDNNNANGINKIPSARSNPSMIKSSNSSKANIPKSSAPINQKYVVKEEKNSNKMDPFAEHNNSMNKVEELSSIRPKFMMPYQKSETLSSINIFQNRNYTESSNNIKDLKEVKSDGALDNIKNEVESANKKNRTVTKEDPTHVIEKDLSYESIILDFDNVPIQNGAATFGDHNRSLSLTMHDVNL